MILDRLHTLLRSVQCPVIVQASGARTVRLHLVPGTYLSRTPETVNFQGSNAGTRLAFPS